MTPDQLATGYFFICMFLAVIAAFGFDRWLMIKKSSNIEPKRRYLVTINDAGLFTQADVAKIRKEFSADTSRDYIFVEAKIERPVEILEIR